MLEVPDGSTLRSKSRSRRLTPARSSAAAARAARRSSPPRTLTPRALRGRLQGPP
jgi:hypothetical protein